MCVPGNPLNPFQPKYPMGIEPRKKRHRGVKKHQLRNNAMQKLNALTANTQNEPGEQRTD